MKSSMLLIAGWSIVLSSAALAEPASAPHSNLVQKVERMAVNTEDQIRLLQQKVEKLEEQVNRISRHLGDSWDRGSSFNTIERRFQDLEREDKDILRKLDDIERRLHRAGVGR